MKAWIFHPVTYVPSRPLPQVWPVPATAYDTEIGERSFHNAIEQAITAEQLGFDGVSVAEHHYAGASLTPNPSVMAGALSQRLKRATIAMLGATIPLTNPVRVAEEYAILDNLTGGRLVAGMLRGTPNEFLTYGTNPDETRAQYEEGVELILKAWTEPLPFGWQGRHYQYRTISVWPRPVQKPYPPVFVSANSRESGSFAARMHLNMGLSFCPVHVAAQLSAFYREQAHKAGWEPAADNMLYRGFIHVAETDQKAMEEVAHTYWQVPTADAKPSVAHSASETSGGGTATATAPADLDVKKALSADQFKSMGLQFCGSPDSVFEQIRQLKNETGVGIIDFVFQGISLPHDMVLHSMELFGKEVLPRMHDL
ncbi:MAG TPA: LLM class flavin-dependent oxidoreductase [Ktedonobacteraceae bacterium]|nr:LLM class flavin-dependent oxidoreductase [Ktedonobacteraceae bacterium]